MSNTEVGKQRLRYALLAVVIGWGLMALSTAETLPAEAAIVGGLVLVVAGVLFLLALLAFLRPKAKDETAPE